MKLWTINRWLRWTGFRVVVGVPRIVLPDDARAVLREALDTHALILRNKHPSKYSEELRLTHQLRHELDEEPEYTRIMLKWIGLPGSEGWKRWE